MSRQVKRDLDEVKKDLLNEFEILEEHLEKVDSEILDNMSELNKKISQYRENLSSAAIDTESEIEKQNEIIAKGFEKITSVLKTNFEIMREQQKELFEYQNKFMENIEEDLEEIQETNKDLIQNMSFFSQIINIIKQSAQERK